MQSSELRLAPEQLILWVEKALDLEKWSIARLVSVFETDTAQASVCRTTVEAALAERSGQCRNAYIVGITGTPGAGKSSLIGVLCRQILMTHPTLSVAVLAVDPSSPESGGALLGDRTRVQLPVGEKRLFFRSQSTGLSLGGIGAKTFQVIRLLRHLFDLVIIETVGIGQNEVNVQKICHHVQLVLQPFSGDQVQFMKAGVMEIPDSFVINKCDETQMAQESLHMLSTSLTVTGRAVSSERSNKQRQQKKVLLTSATQNTGVSELADFMLCLRECAPRTSFYEMEMAFLRDRAEQAFGTYGKRCLDHLLSAGENSVNKTNNLYGGLKSYDQFEASFFAMMQRSLPTPEYFKEQYLLNTPKVNAR
ncbi:MAG: hypothetical protein MI864_06660 [Pseudomonadales bacterium]|nr:hypothetical protein [Pseudomonadales bacterium]